MKCLSKIAEKPSRKKLFRKRLKKDSSDKRDDSPSFLKAAPRSSLNVSTGFSRLDFFDTYRKVTLGNQQSSTPSVAYLRTCDKEKLTPKPFSFLEKQPSKDVRIRNVITCLLYTSPSPRDS